MSGFERDRYAMLDSMDAKSGALLQIGAILLVFLFMDRLREATERDQLLNVAAGLILVSMPLFMSILLFLRRTKEAHVHARSKAFHFAWLLMLAAVALTGFVFVEAFFFGG